MSGFQFLMVFGLLASVKGDTIRGRSPLLGLLWSWLGALAMGYAFFMELIA